MVGAHSHAGVAHFVNDIAVIESYDHLRAFGRVDLVVDRDSGQVLERQIHAPEAVCDPSAAAGCGDYAGRPVTPDRALEAGLGPYAARAEAALVEPLGATVSARIERSFDHESALGNLLTDWMRASRPRADVAVMNGGGIRADLEAGDLTFGALYDVFPFDNRFAFVGLSGREVAELITRNLQHDGSILSLTGIRARVRCAGRNLAVALVREDGRPIADDERLVVLATDFLVTAGNVVFRRAIERGDVRIEEGSLVRDAIADLLRARGGTITPVEVRGMSRRLRYEGERSVRCSGH